MKSMKLDLLNNPADFLAGIKSGKRLSLFLYLSKFDKAHNKERLTIEHIGKLRPRNVNCSLNSLFIIILNNKYHESRLICLCIIALTDLNQLLIPILFLKVLSEHLLKIFERFITSLNC